MEGKISMLTSLMDVNSDVNSVSFVENHLFGLRIFMQPRISVIVAVCNFVHDVRL